jgi:hypothetical protein
MGTNYFLTFNGTMMDRLVENSVKELHIGKSSMGWCFGLHVIPELGLNSLRDWYRVLSKKQNVITNEYREVISIASMLAIITERRSNFKAPEIKTASDQQDLDRYLHANHAALGPNGLLRHKRDSLCIGHGTGPWDLMNGDYS